MTSYEPSPIYYGASSGYEQGVSATHPSRDIRRERITINQLLSDMGTVSGKADNDKASNEKNIQKSAIEGGDPFQAPQHQLVCKTLPSSLKTSGPSGVNDELGRCRTFTPRRFTPINATRSSGSTSNQSRNSSFTPNPYLHSTEYERSSERFMLWEEQISNPLDSLSTQPTPNITQLSLPSHQNKLFPCPEEGCKHVATRKSNLDQHMELHKAVRVPFFCQVIECERFYLRLSDKIKHIKTKHPRVDSERYVT